MRSGARIALGLGVLLAATLVGTRFGWKFVFAPMTGYLIYRWAFTTLRSMAQPAIDGQLEDNEPKPVGRDERVLYWCEECGTELLLLVRGTGSAPRHCGTGMHERAEIMS